GPVLSLQLGRFFRDLVVHGRSQGGDRPPQGGSLLIRETHISITDQLTQHVQVADFSCAQAPSPDFTRTHPITSLHPRRTRRPLPSSPTRSDAFPPRRHSMSRYRVPRGDSQTSPSRNRSTSGSLSQARSSLACMVHLSVLVPEQPGKKEP